MNVLEIPTRIVVNKSAIWGIHAPSCGETDSLKLSPLPSHRTNQ